MRCKGCGSTKIVDLFCLYCNRKQEIQKVKKSEYKKVKSNMGSHKVLYNTELIGNMNTIGYAENCIIRGDMNTIEKSKNVEVIGDMNTHNDNNVIISNFFN